MFHQVPRRIRRNTPPIAKTTPPVPGNTPSIARIIPSILTLPNELLLLVASYLRYRDTYHLVCTNRRLACLLTANLYDDLIKEGMKHLRGYPRDYKNTGPIIKVLMSATKKGHSNVVRNLLDRRVPIKGRLHSVQLLELAVLSGCADTVELFLKRGADPNHTYTIRYPNLRRKESYISEGESLSGISYTRERVRHFLDMFLARGGTPNDTYMRRHLRDQESCNSYLLSRNKGITLLHIASEFDKGGEIIKSLVRYGLDVNSRDVYMMTPLHYAVKCKMVSAILALVDCGADINAVSLSKETPLHIAVGGGVSTANREVVRVLLGLGADSHIKDADGCTAHDVTAIYARCRPRALEMLSLIS